MSPTLRRYHCTDGSPPRRVRKELAALLADGAIVALPTETVYGLAARADCPVAIERLRALKGRPPELPLTWHVGGRDVLGDATELPNTVRRLIERYWPGPLTLVVRPGPDRLTPIADGDWIGVRFPAHTATAELLDALPFPVTLTSANISGAEELCDADAVAEAFGDRIAYLIDDGPTRLHEASAVLRVGSGHFELLRQGLLSIDQLRQTAGLRIGFVCTGNTCRSPMAEILCGNVLAQGLGVAPAHIGDFGFAVESMGVVASDGAPAAEHAREVVAARGLDLSNHASRLATIKRVAELDFVFGLTQSHVNSLRAKLPPRRDGNVLLLDPDGRDVPDPIGGSRDEYERCAAKMEAAIERRAQDWI